MNLIRFHSVVAAVAIAILSSSTYLVQPIFAFEIDQGENEHRQSIKSAINDELVSPASSTSSSSASTEQQTINQAPTQSNDKQAIDQTDEDDDDDGDDDEEQDELVVPKRTALQTDLFEFIDLIPVDEVNELKVRYYVSDPKVRQSFDYMKNYNYSFVQRELSPIHDIKRAVAFVEILGMNLKEIGDALCDRFGPPNDSIYHPTEVKPTYTGGFYALFDDILDVIPQDEVVTLFLNKMDSSRHFSELLEWIGSPDFKAMLHALRYNRDVQRFVIGLRDNGVDILRIYKALRTYFGFGGR